MSAKEQTTAEMLLEMIQRQAEMCQMLVLQSEVLGEIQNGLAEVQESIDRLDEPYVDEME